MQQSTAIDRPAAAAVASFERHVVGALPRLVAGAQWGAVPVATDRDGASVPVRVGNPRRRGAATLYPFGWEPSQEASRPEVDLDLEIAPLGDGASRLQLAGQLHLPWVERWSDEEGAAERHCTIAMAALLDAIAASILDRSDAP